VPLLLLDESPVVPDSVAVAGVVVGSVVVTGPGPVVVIVPSSTQRIDAHTRPGSQLSPSPHMQLRLPGVQPWVSLASPVSLAVVSALVG
jgi:hypothetical protein